MVKSRKFVLNCEFELFGDEVDNVVATCEQLNVHTEDDSIQGAMKKLAKAAVFFFDTAESRYQLEEVLGELVRRSSRRS
ncbi:MAG: hypothetical protein JXQ83_10950 [Candidatus Glassbacteria bacterium]|nr:hypothetical protein [Candidatus Glassbacteria bacterium]